MDFVGNHIQGDHREDGLANRRVQHLLVVYVKGMKDGCSYFIYYWKVSSVDRVLLLNAV